MYVATFLDYLQFGQPQELAGKLFFFFKLGRDVSGVWGGGGGGGGGG